MRDIAISNHLHQSLKRYVRIVYGHENYGSMLNRCEDKGFDKLLREYFSKRGPFGMRPPIAPKRNPFVALCELASKDEQCWCWDLFCTTCGNQLFRLSFKEIVAGKHPDIDWVLHDYGRQVVSNYNEYIANLWDIEWTNRSQRELSRIASTASLEDISKLAKFPDWLGYLGLVLYHTEKTEERSRRLTKAWIPQLIEMVDPDNYAKKRLQEILNDEEQFLRWSTLELVEKALENRVPRGRTLTDE